MAVASDKSSGSASIVVTAASTMYSSATHIYWGSKVRNFSLYVRESSRELFPLCLDSLVQLVRILCWSGILLTRFSSGMLAILLGFNIGSSLDFVVIFVRVLTWGYKRSLSSPLDLGINWHCSDYLFIGMSWSGRYDVGLLSFCRRLDGLIVDNVETWCKLYCIMCQYILKYTIKNKWENIPIWKIQI